MTTNGTRLVHVQKIRPGMRLQITRGRFEEVGIVLCNVTPKPGAAKGTVTVFTGVDFDKPFTEQKVGAYNLPGHMRVHVER